MWGLVLTSVLMWGQVLGRLTARLTASVWVRALELKMARWTASEWALARACSWGGHSAQRKVAETAEVMVEALERTRALLKVLQASRWAWESVSGSAMGWERVWGAL